jgi:hypothetical protein
MVAGYERGHLNNAGKKLKLAGRKGLGSRLAGFDSCLFLYSKNILKNKKFNFNIF